MEMRITPEMQVEAGLRAQQAWITHAGEFMKSRKDDLAIIGGSLAIVIAVKLILALNDVAQVPAFSYVFNTRVYFVTIIAMSLVYFLVKPLKINGLNDIQFDPSAIDTRKYLFSVLAAIPVILMVSVFMVTFSSFKSAIEVFNAFSWDTNFIAMDKAIHGTDPWIILQDYIGYPFITHLLSNAYQGWFLLIYIGTVWFAIFQTDRVLRTRFFLAYFLTWTICGMVLATLLASVGPCFMEPLFGNGHYAQQMAYLHAVNDESPLFVIDVQQQLLYWYRMGENGLGRGITAMPSMHVALAVMYALAMRHVSRVLGWLFAGFAVIIAIGSVHLGYHYAVDGYVAAIVAALIWLGTRPLADMLAGRPRRESGQEWGGAAPAA